MRWSVITLAAVTLLALSGRGHARPHQHHKVAKREAHQLLQAVNDELVHAKRHRRGLVEPALSRHKRQEVDSEEEDVLSREKRQRREVAEPPLQRAKRHKRNIAETELNRQKRKKEADGALPLDPQAEKDADPPAEVLSGEKHQSLEKAAHAEKSKGADVKAHHGHKHKADCKESKKFKQMVKKVMRKAKKSRSNHGHKKKEGKRSVHRKQSKSKSAPHKKDKFANKFKRLGKELTHVSKQMKHLHMLKKDNSNHFKRAKRSKHAKHQK